MDALEHALPGVALNLQHPAPHTACPRPQDDQTAQSIAITPRRLCRIQVTRRGERSPAAPTSSAPALPTSSAHLVHTSNSALQFPVCVRLLGAVDCPFWTVNRVPVSRFPVSYRLLPACCIIIFAGTPTFGAAHTPGRASVSKSPNTTRYDAPCRKLVLGHARTTRQ